MDLRIRFVDGDQIKLEDVKNIRENDDNLVFDYTDSSLGQATISIRKSSIIFIAQPKGEDK